MPENCKKRWRDLICSSAYGGRFLGSIGKSIALASTAAEDAESIEKLLHSLSRGERDIRIIAGVIDLLNSEYLSFFSREIWTLLDHLANEVIKEEEVVGPALRGNPRWDKTILARTAGTLPIGKYYTRTARRSFEKAENLLLKWLLTDISRQIHYLERQLGISAIPVQLRLLLTKIEAVSRHHWLASIEAPEKITSEMLKASFRSRRSEYRMAASLAQRRHKLSHDVAHSRWNAILSLLSANWLEPINPDDLFELYALTVCLETIGDELGFGTPQELGLVIRKREYVAKFTREKTSLEVFFDQTPQKLLRAPTRYVEVLRAHTGVSGSSHRPDITIVKTTENKEQTTLLVEVKHTQSREYLSDSVYKAFAYIHDYAELWPDKNIAPKVVLFVPDEVRLLPGSNIPEVAFASSDNRQSLSILMRHALNIGINNCSTASVCTKP